MHPLTHIACGDQWRGAVGEVISHLADVLDRLLTRSAGLIKSGDATDVALFGPFLGRATIEVSLTAIVARFDPYRILAIRKSQKMEGYDPKIRNPLSFNWTMDVQGEERSKEWIQKPTLRELQRALLCRHFNDLFWEEAFSLLVDTVPVTRGSGWMRRLKKIDPEGFWLSMRQQADRVYSELSKGIHHEFVIPTVVRYDRATVADMIARSWELVAALGLTTCFSPATTPLSKEDPVVLYEEVQKELYA